MLQNPSTQENEIPEQVRLNIENWINQLENNRSWYDVKSIHKSTVDYPNLLPMYNARLFFISQHNDNCNHYYDEKLNLKYSYHLESVDYIFRKLYPLYEENQTTYRFGQKPTFNTTAVYIPILYGHDSIEDARLSYNDIMKTMIVLGFSKDNSYFIAEGIFTLTEYKGRNRTARKPDEYYTNLIKEDIFLLVKLADICANIQQTKLTLKSIDSKIKDLEHLMSFIQDAQMYRFRAVFEVIYTDFLV